MVIKVKKKSGRVQTFDIKKLTRSISRAGTKYILAREIAKKVKERIDKNSPVVPSSTIRKYVLYELKKERAHSALSSFQRYRKLGKQAKTSGKVHKKQQQKAKLRSKKILGGHRSSRKHIY